MTTETLTSLNTTTLIGHTAHRGTAWHYRAEEQGEEPNHYAGPIPPQDVARRLFGWRALSLPVAVERPADILTMTHRGADGMPRRWVQIEGRQAIARSDEDDGHVLGVFTDAYEAHQYTEYLLTAVGNILDDSLSISSAGVLRGGAVAWVEVSVPESVVTPEGVEFRPNLLATTTLDGSLATTYKRTVTDVVCDNTRAAALREEGQELKIRHSRHSRLRLADARGALNIVHGLAEDYAAEVAELCRTVVDARTWDRFLDTWVPLVGTDGEPLSTRRRETAEAKREALAESYVRDERVAPWAGTAHAVLQAVNTYEHHHSPAAGSRSERNMRRTLSGAYEQLDRRAWEVLQQLLPTS
ncbi:phage/plasmid-like protein TIGR03299 [Georgenia satyanarayanai]|uniref:Phage/plasmid-like protein TIGR03299 n=1 Tax=Georgenia satyanarayanai TaxID=860221 RepID=A0A2Y8ZXG8_9MICO|nr:DUF932 domain-containing protein [Georgenia satyanarayanai]PYG01961.1 phage/plasmid-like protein (TIGR03299 family) [Georgenia satyanarayanai]SSA36764.1 phage/plasmid-like protein TIGR03299 [Georgenia satyanarayanai]